MPGRPTLVLDNLGCSGRVTLPAGPAGVAYARVPFGNRRGPSPEEPFALQWSSSRAAAEPVPAQPVAGTSLLLTGIVVQPCSATLVRGIVDDLARGRHDRLIQLGDEAAGCLVAHDRVVLFRGVASADQLFYRRSGSRIEWSTDPTDLLDDPLMGVDRDAIWRACRGENVFVYRDLSFVRPGQLVVFDRSSTRSTSFDRITPLDVPRRTSLRQYAELTYDLLVQATRAYAGRRVGVLLSGGVDSSTVLMALADGGADVTAYHMGTDDPLADESVYAREVCRRLDVPLVSVTTDLGGYFSTGWDFSHPFNHVWFKRISEIADRVREDGVGLLLTGLAGDILFGPLHYGMHNLLSRDITWRERRHMLLGLACSRWELGRLLRSIAPSYSLTQDAEATSEVAPSVDFLTPWPDAPPETYDLDFLPQEHTLNLAVWRPRDIMLGNPLGSRELRRLALRLPGAYKLIPFQGRLIDKPVLRLVASRRLPALIWRHYGRSWLSAPDEAWCLRHPEVFADLIGTPDCELVKLGLVNPSRLAAVIADPAALRRNTEALVSSAMTELFLRSLRRRAPDLVRG